MARIVVWIFRLLPVEIILLLAAFFGYKWLSNRKNSTLAKEVLIKAILWFNVVLGAAFLIIGLYAVVDGNHWVLEIALAFAIICVCFIAGALIAKHNFMKHRPNYPWKRNNAAKIFRKGKANDNVAEE